jgi:hypothetical protein
LKKPDLHYQHFAASLRASLVRGYALHSLSAAAPLLCRVAATAFGSFRTSVASRPVGLPYSRISGVRRAMLSRFGMARNITYKRVSLIHFHPCFLASQDFKQDATPLPNKVYQRPEYIPANGGHVSEWKRIRITAFSGIPCFPRIRSGGRWSSGGRSNNPVRPRRPALSGIRSARVIPRLPRSGAAPDRRTFSRRPR